MEKMEQLLSSKKQVEIVLHKYQSRAIDSNRRFIALIAGTGGGKTYFGPIWLLKEIIKYPGEEYLVAAPTYKMLTRTTINNLIKYFNQINIKYEYKKAEGKIIFLPQFTSILDNEEKNEKVNLNNSVIYLGSTDRPETLEGIHVKGVWLDEAGQMKYWAWVVIQARLGQKLGRALLTTTPYGMNWLYSDFWKRWRDGDKNYDVIQFSSIDNPYYPKEEFERASSSLSKEVFEMRYLGQFRKMSGLIYSNFDSNYIIEPFDIPDGWRRIAGIDFGWNNPFVFLDIAIDNDDNVYVVSDYCRPERTLQEHIQEIKNITRDKHYEGVFCDPSGKQQIEDLKSSLSLPIREANNDVFSGIEHINSLIKTNRIKVFNTCKNFLDEIEVYHWKDTKDGNTKDEPEKLNDHCMDAMRYAIYTFRKTGTKVFYSTRGRLRDDREQE